MTTTNVKPWKVGDRVVFTRDVERYPFFIVDWGTTGRVTAVTEHGDMLVKVDGEIPGLTDDDEWTGEFQWTPTNGDEPDEMPFVKAGTADADTISRFIAETTSAKERADTGEYADRVMAGLATLVGLGFHPDTRASEYGIFTPEQASAFDSAIDWVCGLSRDQYAPIFEAWKVMGWL